MSNVRYNAPVVRQLTAMLCMVPADPALAEKKVITPTDWHPPRIHLIGFEEAR